MPTAAHASPSATRLLVAASAALRLEAAADFLEDTHDQGCLLIATTSAAADDFLRNLVAGSYGRAPRAGFLALEKLTLPQLVARLNRDFGEDCQPVGGLGLEALAARAIAAVGSETLRYFGPIVAAPGLPRAVRLALEDLRLARVDRDALARSGKAGHDLALWNDALQKQLDEAGLADGARRVESSLAALPRLARRPLLLLDLEPKSRLETELLTGLVAQSSVTLATAVLGDDASVGALGAALGCPATLLPARMGRVDALERLRRELFNPESSAPPDLEAELEASVEIFAAPGESRECVEIVRRVLDLAAQGTPFDQVAVVLRDPSTYLPLLEEACLRADIPWHASLGSRRPDRAGRAFLALLACADENLSARRFAEYLSLDETPAIDASAFGDEIPWVEPQGDQMVFSSPAPAGLEEKPKEKATIEPPERWEELLVDAAVIAGAPRWRRRLEGAIAELRFQVDFLDEKGEESQREPLERKLATLQTLRAFALPLIEEMAAWPERATWGEWLERFGGLASRALVRPTRVLELLAELRPMAAVGPLPLAEARRVLEPRLSTLRIENEGRRFGKLLILTPEELRGREFHSVFVPGLAEGVFPRRLREDPLLLDATRRSLSTWLETQDLRVGRERTLLRLTVGAARARLFCSFPTIDSLAGRARVPSFYALEIMRAILGSVPEAGALGRRALEASTTWLNWPAPRSPEAAVDDTEFDLALLADLENRPAEERRSAARYLLDLNPHLHRSLRNRYSRWSRKLGKADGLVEPDQATLLVLASHRLGERAFSATALQNFAVCPLRFFYQTIVGLSERGQALPLDRLDPQTRGALFHRVLFLFQREIRDRRLMPPARRHNDLLRQILDSTLSTVARQAEEDLFPAIPGVFRDEIENLRLDLNFWLEKSFESTFRPLHFELSFGRPLRPSSEPVCDELSQEEEVTLSLRGDLSLRLRGAIDQVEEDAQGRTLRVTDFKTGAAPEAGYLVVGGGERLQPLLYALAAEQILGRPAAVGRLHFATRRGLGKSLEVNVTELGRRALADVLETIDRALAEGFLPAFPRHDACRLCDFRPVCGPLEPERTLRKLERNRERLAPLIELRSRK